MTDFKVSAPKDPQDTGSKYYLDWTPYLDGEVLATSTWAITGRDSALTKDAETNTSTVANIYVSGGTSGRAYTLTNTVTISGQVRERSIELFVKD